MEENKNMQESSQNQEQKTAADIIISKLQQRNKLNKQNTLDSLKDIQNQIKEEAVEEHNIEDVDKAEEESIEIEEESHDLPNYNEYSREQLVEMMENLLKEPIDVNIKKGQIIKDVYYTKRNNEIKEQKAKFVEDGGDESKFEFVDSLEDKFKVLYEKYKELKNEKNKQKEAEIKRNTERKLEIIGEIDKLIEKGEALRTTFDEFHKLKEQWESLGQVDPKMIKEINEKYEHTLQKFYNWVKINKELRDFDLKKNYEQKLKLCEEAEALLIENKIIRAYKKLQSIKERWYNIGPVPNEHKDDIISRFKEVEKILNRKHYEFFQKIRQQQKDNLKAKELLCEEAEKIANCECTSSKDWAKKNEELDELLKLWKMIGFAPKKYNNSIFERFIAARKRFFERKREYFKDYFEDLEANYQKKLELVYQAEANKDNTDFKDATKIFLDLQNKWKEIGPVPNAKKDDLWKRFNEACNSFFENKRKYYSNKEEEEKQNLIKKQEVLNELKNFEFVESSSENLKKLQQLQQKWSQIGYVPVGDKDELYKQYRQTIDSIYQKLNVSKNHQEIEEKETLEEKVQRLLQSSDKPSNRLRMEIEKMKNKIATINADIVKLENNMSFFVKSKSSEGVLKNFKLKIDRLSQIKEENEKYLHLLLKAYKDAK